MVFTIKICKGTEYCFSLVHSHCDRKSTSESAITSPTQDRQEAHRMPAGGSQVIEKMHFPILDCIAFSQKPEKENPFINSK